MSVDDGLFLFPPGNKIDSLNIRFDERVQRVPFLHNPSPSLTRNPMATSGDSTKDLSLKDMMKKVAIPTTTTPRKPLSSSVDDEDLDGMPSLAIPPIKKKPDPPSKKKEDKMDTIEEEDDDEDGGDVDVIGDEMSEEDDEEEEDEDVEGSQISKFARELGMNREKADEWADNFLSDQDGDLDAEDQERVVLIADILLKLVSNKKGPYPGQLSEVSRNLLNKLDVRKNQMIEAI